MKTASLWILSGLMYPQIQSVLQFVYFIEVIEAGEDAEDVVNPGNRC